MKADIQPGAEQHAAPESGRHLLDQRAVAPELEKQAAVLAAVEP